MSIQSEVKSTFEEAFSSGDSAILVETVGLAKQVFSKILRLTGGCMFEICKVHHKEVHESSV